MAKNANDKSRQREYGSMESLYKGSLVNFPHSFTSIWRLRNNAESFPTCEHIKIQHGINVGQKTAYRAELELSRQKESPHRVTSQPTVGHSFAVPTIPGLKQAMNVSLFGLSPFDFFFHSVLSVFVLWPILFTARLSMILAIGPLVHWQKQNLFVSLREGLNFNGIN